MLALESVQKGNLIISNQGNLSSEEVSGILNRSLFIWLNSLLLRGYRQVLSPTELMEIDSRMRARFLSHKLPFLWKACE